MIEEGDRLYRGLVVQRIGAECAVNERAQAQVAHGQVV